MAHSALAAAAASRFDRLQSFLSRDPANLSLLSDAAQAALDAGRFDDAQALVERYAELGEPTAALRNLSGMAAIGQQRFDTAAQIFETLLGAEGSAPEVRVNLAWVRALQQQYQSALDLLDEDAIAASPQAAGLKVQMLHHLDRYEEGLDVGAALAKKYPQNQELLGALATLAMDAEKPELARQYALGATGTADGSAALGFLTLGDHDTAASLKLFDQAIAQKASNPRAWIGRGLALQIAGDNQGAVEAIDRGAELFVDHLGSWVAAAWSHLVAGDRTGARQRFDKVVALDPNFSEGQGGLAVLDILDGDIAAAKRRAEIAVRLDRNSFGGALARILLLEQSGQPEAAQQILERALNTPLGADGRTISQAMIGFGTRRA